MLKQLSTTFDPVQVELPKLAGRKSPLWLIIGLVRRQLWVILTCLILITLCGAFVANALRPIYTAAATIMIDSRTGGIQQKSVLGDSSPNDAAWVDSQIGILLLDRGEIGNSIVKRLKLAEDPAILGPLGAFGGDFIAPISRILGHQDVATENSGTAREELEAQIADSVAGALDIKRVGFSYLVNVTFSSHSPQQSVKIVNAAADAYISAQMKAKFDNLRQASDWLQERYKTLSNQATVAERAVVEFKSKYNIVTAGGKLMSDQQLTEINDRLGTSRAKVADEQARLDQIETVLRNQEANGTFDTTVPDALLNPIVTRLRGQYLDLINREADWSKRFGPNHQAVLNLRNQARDIRNSTHEELKRIAESYRSDLEIAKINTTELEKQLASLVAGIPNDAQIELRALETTAQSYRTFYDNFFLNYTESVQQQSSPIAATRVVSYSNWANRTSMPPARIALMSVFGGLALGLGIGALREFLDDGLRTGSEAQNALKLECLALIPVIRSFAKSSSRANRLISHQRSGSDLLIADRDLNDQRIINSSAGPLSFVVESPFSPFSEAIRSIKMSADLRGKKDSSKIIGITSSVPREGKSTIATALAALVAQIGARVILVDCDLRNPSLTQLLAPEASCGILEVISGDRSLENSIWTDLETGLDFLPAANVSLLSNTDQILSGGPMLELFDKLRKSYEYVIVDLSPLLPVVDVRATTRLVDFYILLIEWGHTGSEIVHEALRVSNPIYNNILGFALNKVNMNSIGRYKIDYGRYGYTRNGRT